MQKSTVSETIETLAAAYFLSEHAIRKIIYNK